MLLLFLQGLAIGLIKILLVFVPAFDCLVVEEDVEPAVVVGPIEVVSMKQFGVVVGLLLEIDGIVVPRRLVDAEQLLLIFGLR